MKETTDINANEQKILLFRPIDDLLFNLMYQDKDACQELIRTILEDDSLIVLEVRAQDTIPNLLGRGVRLDVTCKMQDGRIVNVEVQRFDSDDHYRRIRYNSSVLTARHTSKGTDFKDVVDVYVIYITEFDIIISEKTVCHIQSVIQETGDVIDDGLHRIIVNAAKNDGSKQARLMKHFRENYFEDDEFPETSKQIKYYKKNPEGRKNMCNLMQEIVNEEKARDLVRYIETIAESIRGTEEDACHILKVSYDDYKNAKKYIEEIEMKNFDKVIA
ncbi:MAG: PD-(D/E)XK nuclease family transposase [Anaerolineaceae bacterium]|nr:PD-(D/E)XK nuclease family transposase [Anaerolineaceae bacterium]